MPQKTGNVTRAAERIGRTQSAVSVQIKRLEEVLGESVFARGSRGVALTAQGEALLVNAQRIVALLDETMATIRTVPDCRRQSRQRLAPDSP